MEDNFWNNPNSPDKADTLREFAEMLNSDIFAVFEAYLSFQKDMAVDDFGQIPLDEPTNKILANYINCREKINVINEILEFILERKNFENLYKE